MAQGVLCVSVLMSCLRRSFLDLLPHCCSFHCHITKSQLAYRNLVISSLGHGHLDVYKPPPPKPTFGRKMKKEDALGLMVFPDCLLYLGIIRWITSNLCHFLFWLLFLLFLFKFSIWVSGFALCLDFGLTILPSFQRPSIHIYDIKSLPFVLAMKVV